MIEVVWGVLAGLLAFLVYAVARLAQRVSRLEGIEEVRRRNGGR